MRKDIKMGYSCNNNCLFCINDPKNRSMKIQIREILPEINGEDNASYDTICLTGGEPLMNKDIFIILDNISKDRYQNILIQTNGKLLSYTKFAAKILSKGVNQFLFSIHGHTPQIHDGLTQSEGNLNLTWKGIDNVGGLGGDNVYLMVNTTIVKQNYLYLGEITELLITHGVKLHQFTFVNPEGNAWINREKIVPRMSIVVPYLIGTIDKHKNLIRFCIEGIPYCLLGGYEEYIEEPRIPKTRVVAPDKKYLFDKNQRLKGKFKNESCQECKWDYLCEGVWNRYVELYGFSEFKPVKK